MRIDYKHSLSLDEAYNRIADLLQSLQRQYADKVIDPQTIWNPDHTEMGFSMKIMGFKTEGQVDLKEGQITLEGKVPWAARPFSGRIETMIKKRLEELFS